MLIKRLFWKIFRKFIIKLGILIYEANGAIANKTLPKFGNNPKNLVIDLPRRIVNPEYMFLGDNTWLGPGKIGRASCRERV